MYGIIIHALSIWSCANNFSDSPSAEPSVQPSSQEFFSDRVMLILEWILSNSLGHYQQLLLPNISISVVPNDPEVEIEFIRNTSVRLILSYNTPYNISVTQPGICGQPNQTISIELNYCELKCFTIDYRATYVYVSSSIIYGFTNRWNYACMSMLVYYTMS